MSDKEKGLPSLRKTPVDFLSPEEARQALKPDVALDATEAARALRSEPNSENIQMRAVFALRRAQTMAAQNALAVIANRAQPQVATAARNGLRGPHS